MTKKGGLGAFLGESLGITLPEDVVVSNAKKKDAEPGFLGGVVSDILGDVVVPEVRAGLKQGAMDFVDDIFHKSPAPEPKKKAEKAPHKPVPQVADTSHRQDERLLQSGVMSPNEQADVPQQRGNIWFNTASVIFGEGVRMGSGAVRFAVRVGKAAQETHRRSVAEKQAKARENANIVDGEVKE